jgi:hypothetical protein
LLTINQYPSLDSERPALVSDTAGIFRMLLRPEEPQHCW